MALVPHAGWRLSELWNDCGSTFNGLSLLTWRGVIDPNDDLDELVAGYFRDVKILEAERARRVAEHSQIESTPINGYDGRLFDWLTEMLNYGPTDGPEQAWPIILTLVERAPDADALTLVGSGALEDLVNRAGARFVDRIVAKAADPRFRTALRGVWPNSGVPDAITSLIRHPGSAADRSSDGPLR